MMDLKNEERVAEYGESSLSSTKVGLNMPYDINSDKPFLDKWV